MNALQVFLEDCHCIAINVAIEESKFSSFEQVMCLFNDSITPILKQSKGSIPIYILMVNHCPFLISIEKYCRQQDYKVIIIPPFGFKGGTGMDLVYNKISKQLVNRGIRPQARRSIFFDMDIEEEEFSDKIKEHHKNDQKGKKIYLFRSNIKRMNDLKNNTRDSNI